MPQCASHSLWSDTMQDIRSGLQERLEATKKERNELTAQLQRLQARERLIRDLLREEEECFHGSRHLRSLVPGSRHAPVAGTHLKYFVLESLADGHAWSLDQLKEHARGMGLVRDCVSGRSLNITLVNLHRSGRVRRLPNGRWQLCSDSPQTSLAFKGTPAKSSAGDPSDAAA